MLWLRVSLSGAAVAVVAACGMTPVKHSDGHLRAEAPKSQGEIPPPVQLAPPLPKPRPTVRPETYSVVVSNVRVDDLLFALARDAKLNVDIHPGVIGTVTLNAIDQTLPQLLTRIARQIDMRYEMDGPNLVVMRDTPYLRLYRIDYVNLSRDSTTRLSLSTQVSGAAGVAGGAASGGSNNSTSTISNTSNNRFWETLIANVKDILRETDKLMPASGATLAVAKPAAQAQAGAAGAGAAQPPASAQPAIEFREAASVIANPENGILSIRASSRQHEKILEFLDQVMANARRQVLIEATIAEVQLNNQYQRGIDWQRLRTNATTLGLAGFGTGNSGLEFGQSSPGAPPNAFIFGSALNSLNFSAAINLLETFGDVKVLSSPKISVINNQPAVLRVVRNLIYFTITPGTTTISASGGGTVNAPATFTTTPNSVPEGLIMTVVPQISDADIILLNVRPTITRKVRDIPDPNPALIGTVGNLVPEMQTQEMESLLRVHSGQTAVLGGLMQDSVSNSESGIPGATRVPGLGDVFLQRKDTVAKTELVIFLRTTVIRDASIDGDYREFRGLLPGEDFLRTPNPGRPGPAGEAASR